MSDDVACISANPTRRLALTEVYRHKSRERIRVRVLAHMVRSAQGKVLYCEGTVEGVSGESMFDESGKFTGYRVLGRDITKHKRDEEAIRQLAFHIPLTDMPNWRLLMDRLQKSLVTIQTNWPRLSAALKPSLSAHSRHQRRGKSALEEP